MTPEVNIYPCMTSSYPTSYLRPNVPIAEGEDQPEGAHSLPVGQRPGGGRDPGRRQQHQRSPSPGFYPC